DAIKLHLFLNAHHKGSLPMQLKVVWNQLLQADPEGTTLIFYAALHFEQPYTTQPRIRGTLAACTLAKSSSDPLHRRLQPLRYLHDCFDCFRLEQKLPGGTFTHWKTPP
ncbi:MAG TPA: hypothetical protein VIJ25_16665, partial [Methylococcales bacterium]